MYERKSVMHNILIYSDSRSYLLISLENHLIELGYQIINVGTKVSEIDEIKDKIDTIVIYADSELLKKMEALVFLRDRALENDTPFFIIGDMNELDSIRGIVPNHLIQQEFQRPVNVKDVGSKVDEYIQYYASQNKKKVLVVDDSGAMLRSVKGWLEPKYQVVLANSGAMAIKYLSTNRPDLVLLDYEMPVINGKQVLEMIRSEAEFSTIPVIFLTGKNDKESIQQVLGLKPEGYILKSTKPDLIVEMIDEFFMKKKAL
jgi:CheY-like chemotaxis protein